MEKIWGKNQRDWKIPGGQLRGDGHNKAAGAIWLHLNAAGSLQPGQSISSKPEETLLEKSTTNANTNTNTSRIQTQTEIQIQTQTEIQIQPGQLISSKPEEILWRTIQQMQIQIQTQPEIQIQTQAEIQIQPGQSISRKASREKQNKCHQF